MGVRWRRVATWTPAWASLDPSPLERAPPGFFSKAGRWGHRGRPCVPLAGCCFSGNRVPWWGRGWDRRARSLGSLPNSKMHTCQSHYFPRRGGTQENVSTSSEVNPGNAQKWGGRQAAVNRNRRSRSPVPPEAGAHSRDGGGLQPLNRKHLQVRGDRATQGGALPAPVLQRGAGRGPGHRGGAAKAGVCEQLACWRQPSGPGNPPKDGRQSLHTRPGVQGPGRRGP